VWFNGGIAVLLEFVEGKDLIFGKQGSALFDVFSRLFRSIET